MWRREYPPRTYRPPELRTRLALANAAVVFPTPLNVERGWATLPSTASLVLSSGGLYVLGGYSRLHMGPSAPYTSDLNAVHAGLGQRLFFAGNHAAVRLEARAYYRGPGAGFGQEDEVIHVVGSVGMSFFVGPGGEKTRRYY